MGLGVSVYKNIKKTEDNYDYDFQAYVIDDSWKDRIKNLEYNAYYIGDVTDTSISYPYSAHNRFRVELIKLIERNDLLASEGYIQWDKLDPKMPFYELINFADNEGCLDWEVSEKLYNDFFEWELQAERKYEGYDQIHNLRIYKKWLSIFEEAKDKGVVVFC